MPDHEITLEKIMNRIKVSMQEARKDRNRLKPQTIDENWKLEYKEEVLQHLAKLNVEIEQNNRGWLVDPEYRIASHRPRIGRFIVFGKKIIRKTLRWYINPAFEKQRNFNGSVTRSLNLFPKFISILLEGMDSFKKRTESLQATNERLSKELIELQEVLARNEESEQWLSSNTSERVVNLAGDRKLTLAEKMERDVLEVVNKRVNEVEEAVNEKFKQMLDTCRIEIEEKIDRAIEKHNLTIEEKLKAMFDERLLERNEIEQYFIAKIHEIINLKISGVINPEIERKGLQVVEQYQNSINQLDEKMSEEIGKLEDLTVLTNAKVKRLVQARVDKYVENNVNQDNITDGQSTYQSEKSDLKIDYFLFEQKFRGSRAKIIERQKFYLPTFKNCQNVLDIGCGRGEFIELLRSNGVQVSGIDLNQDMVDYCKERGFQVEYANALDYLSRFPDNTFDGIFMAQVIEHLTTEQALQVLELIHRVLTPNGVVVIETINVQSVFAMNNWFYMDPTHTKPVHPATLDFMIQSQGFSEVKTEYLSPVPGKGIPALRFEDVNIENFNHAMAELSGLIYGYQDYAIIARK